MDYDATLVRGFSCPRTTNCPRIANAEASYGGVVSTPHHHHKRHPDRFPLSWLVILWSFRFLVAVLVGAGLFEGARTAAFLRGSTRARGHVTSRSEMTREVGYDGYRGLRFSQVTTQWVRIEFVDSAGVAASELLPEYVCWGVDESDIPIRFNFFSYRPGIRVDTFIGLWGAPTLTLLVGVLIGAFVELVMR